MKNLWNYLIFRSCLVKKSSLILTIMLTQLHAELLIVKKITDRFVPLTKEESMLYGKQITDILLKYQWPMCIASTLTEEEQKELLKSGIPNGEEIFIQNKLQEVLGLDMFHVIFIPTAMYELFCIDQFYKNNQDWRFSGKPYKFFNQNNPFNLAGMALLYNKAADLATKQWNIDLGEILNDTKSASSVIYQKIYEQYQRCNALFYDTRATLPMLQGKEIVDMTIFAPTDESAWFYINNGLFALLLSIYPELSLSTDSFALSDAIKTKAAELIMLFISNLKSMPLKLFTPMIDKIGHNSECVLKMVEELIKEPENQIVARVVELEYEARSLNKGLLLRGTSYEEMQVGFGKPFVKKTLAGTTVLRETREVKVQDSPYTTFAEVPVAKLYKQKSMTPYSISFGNSLFAGFLVDCGACAYYYLAHINFQSFLSSTKNVGYGLLIDKKDYIQHFNLNLFFISSLASIASLFQNKEYFHSRTKAATLSSTKQNLEVIGLFNQHIADPYGFLLITRDPLRHAELFSQFLVENGRLIQKGDESTLTDDEKLAIEQIMPSQLQAVDFYKKIRIMAPLVEKKEQKYKEVKKGKSPLSAPAAAASVTLKL